MDIIDKIKDIFKKLKSEKFTGILELKIIFNQGGIRDLKKFKREEIK